MNSSYNQQILAQRKAKGLSRKEAARQIGISSFSLFLYENGYFKPTRKALAKIEHYYGFNVDYTGDNEYPSATYEEKDVKPKKKKIIICSILCGLSALFIATGSILFASSAKGTDSFYGSTYVEAKQKAIANNKKGRDLLTDLEYYRFDYDSNTGSGSASMLFYTTNSILFFNDSTFVVNVYFESMKELGMGRLQYKFGGNLGVNSYICSFTYGSSDGGLFFSCDFNYQGEEATDYHNLKVFSEIKVKASKDLILTLYNYAIDDAAIAFDDMLTSELGKPVSFYKDYLPAREKGREVLFNMQITGLAFLLPSVISFFVTGALLLGIFLRRFKIDVEDGIYTKKENGKPLPKDLPINMGIPDYMIIRLAKVVSYLSLFLLLFSTIGGLFLKLPPLFTNKTFLTILQLSFVAAPILKQLVIFRSIDSPRILFIEMCKFAIIHIFIATIETMLIGITDAWGYDIGSLLYQYLPSTIFLSIALNYLLFFFLFFTPTFIANKGKAINIIWKSLSLVVVGMIVAITIIGDSYVLFYGVKRNIILDFWFSNSKIILSVVSILFIYTMFFINLVLERRYGREGFAKYKKGNTYSLIFNSTCSLVLLAIGLIDIAFKNNQVAYYIGLGHNIWILALIPFIFFIRSSPNMMDLIKQNMFKRKKASD